MKEEELINIIKYLLPFAKDAYMYQKKMGIWNERCQKIEDDTFKEVERKIELLLDGRDEY